MGKKKPAKVSGGISCQASSGGRRLTLDPIKLLPVKFDLSEVESTIPCGFKQHWAEGDNEGKKFEITTGAGVGSPYLTFHYEGKEYCAHLNEIVGGIIDAIEASR